MLPGSNYYLRQVVTTGSQIVEGPTLTFTTGTVTQVFPTVSLAVDPGSQTSLNDRVLLHGMLVSQRLSSVLGAFYFLTHPVAGGTMLVIASSGRTDDYLVEVDLAGNIVRETDLLRVDAQLAPRGIEPVVSFHDAARRFSNGQTLLIGMVQRTAAGGSTILGDMVIALDTCETDYGTFCPVLNPQAIDWTHANSVSYTSDNNLLLSLRNQDWVVKIDYRGGYSMDAWSGWHLHHAVRPPLPFGSVTPGSVTAGSVTRTT